MSDADSLLGIAHPSSRASVAEHGSLVDRYRDAYCVGSAIIAFSVLIKLFAWLLAIGIWIAGFVVNKQMRGDGVPFVTGLVFGTAMLAFFFVLGVLVAAIGQILRASLDTAVNTSPFLNESEKRQAIG